MTAVGTRFSLTVARALETADFSIRQVAPGDHRKLYNLVRVTMSTLAPVDSFYIAFLRDEHMLVIPYVYDGNEHEHAGFQTYGPDGLTAWIKKNARPYRYGSDKGHLLHRGHTFGDHERLSRDAVVVPLLESSEDGQRVVGLASMLTYQPDAYSDEAVRAFEWLARRTMRALAREREDAHELAGFAEEGSRSPLIQGSVPGVVEMVTHALNSMTVRITAAIHRPAGDLDAADRALHDLLEQCERLQTDIAELLLMPTNEGADLLATLTPREREVAGLIADGLTNEEISTRLVISEKTTKTHVTRILKKFGVRQRSAVAAKLRPF
ncbi:MULTISPECIES: response regulator transcription factor [unclassified Micromonospora]|uniref:response regulator transcription factor n=1 Tax=unclassified Micromonospora TaxID=2617518 RepID=UPI00362F0469